MFQYYFICKLHLPVEYVCFSCGTDSFHLSQLTEQIQNNIHFSNLWFLWNNRLDFSFSKSLTASDDDLLDKGNCVLWLKCVHLNAFIHFRN